MAEIIDSFEGSFIGTVVGYDTATREVDVFIPKLMPGIPDGQKNIKTKTNLGNNSIKIKYNANITLSSSIRVKAENADDPLPNIGSKVSIYFLEGQFRWGYWKKFNPNGDYEVIEEEKYAKLYTIRIGEKEVLVEEEDSVEIELPDGFDVILTEDRKNKVKHFRISQDNEIINRVTQLENKVGNDETIQHTTDLNGNQTEEAIFSSGLYRKIKKTNTRIDDLIDSIGSSGIEYEYTPVETCVFEYNKEYFVLANGEYIELELDTFHDILDKENYLQTLLNQGNQIYIRKSVQGEATGIYARIAALEALLKK